MLILTVRTDHPEAMLGLYDDFQEIGSITWQAHRLLGETLHLKVRELLQQHAFSLQDLKGIVVFRGPGSFTGLRISLAAMNALGYGLDIPVAGGSGDQWTAEGVALLTHGVAEYGLPVLPEYGAPVRITPQRG